MHFDDRRTSFLQTVGKAQVLKSPLYSFSALLSIACHQPTGNRSGARLRESLTFTRPASSNRRSWNCFNGRDGPTFAAQALARD